MGEEEIAVSATDATQAQVKLVTQEGQAWPLTHDETIIGRAREADVVIPDGEISRMHASIERSGSRYVLLDLGSTNGTRWNGQRVGFDPINLSDGDVIALGETVYVTFSRQAPEPRPLPFNAASTD